MISKKVILAPGYPPSRVWRPWYLSYINWLIVIPAQAGIQKWEDPTFYETINFEEKQREITPSWQALVKNIARSNLKAILVIEYLNLGFICNLVLVICDLKKFGACDL